MREFLGLSDDFRICMDRYLDLATWFDYERFVNTRPEVIATHLRVTSTLDLEGMLGAARISSADELFALARHRFLDLTGEDLLDIRPDPYGPEWSM